MGTGVSGLYAGTVGSSPVSAATFVAMDSSLTAWVESESKRLLQESKRKRKEFNTACIAVDTATGQCFYGRNKGIALSGADKHEALFGVAGILPKESYHNYSVDNCAEVDAINNALNAGAQLKNLVILTKKTEYKGQCGTLKRACKNCTHAFKGKIKKNYSGWREDEDERS